MVLDFFGPLLNVGPGWQYAYTDQILSAIGSCLVQIVKVIQKDSSPMVKIATFLCPNIKHFFQTYCQLKTPELFNFSKFNLSFLRILLVTNLRTLLQMFPM